MKAALEGGFNDKDAWSRINFAGASSIVVVTGEPREKWDKS